jgi:diguanylate cyclase (GGDEF)-like protein
MSADQLNLEDFPNSAYVGELRRRPGRLRFDSPLEAEYLDSHLQRVRLRVRVWFTIALALSAGFSIGAVRMTGLGSWYSLMYLALILPTAVAVAWLAWSARYRRLYLPLAGILVPIHNACVAISLTMGMSLGHQDALATFAVNIVGLFFFAGLTFRQALCAAAVMLGTFSASATALHMNFALFLDCLVMAMLSGVIAAIVYRDVEVANRRSFLENAVIRDLVARDALSGLMNRRTFDAHLRLVWQHALREQRPVAVLMIDIDHFKQFNDAMGHQAADEVLRKVADTIREFAHRPLDLAARYGGEEFALILYDLSTPHVQQIAERLRETVESLGNIAPAGRAVTVSVGVGMALPTIGRTPEGALQLADEALYDAKRAGRNRVIVRSLEAYALLDTGRFNATPESRAAVG